MILVTGGTGSGKSEYAESIAVEAAKSLGLQADDNCGSCHDKCLNNCYDRCLKENGLEVIEESNLLYVATMSKAGEDAQRRISRHRQMRYGKGFETLESMYLDADIEVFRGKVVLLEDLSNLLSNYMFLRDKTGEDSVDIIYNLLININNICQELIIVTNEIFSDGAAYEDSVVLYIKNLASLNRRLAVDSKEFVEVVYGIPVALG